MKTYRHTDINASTHNDITKEVHTSHKDIHKQRNAYKQTYIHKEMNAYIHRDLDTDIHNYIKGYIHTYIQA